MMDYGEAMMIPGQTDTKVRSANDHNIIGEDSKSGPQQPTGFNLMLIQASTALTKFLESWFGIVNAHHYFFLALLGIITATVCFCTDLCTVYLIDRNHHFPIIKNHSNSEALNCQKWKHWVPYSLPHIRGVCRGMYDDSGLYVVSLRPQWLMLLGSLWVVKLKDQAFQRSKPSLQEFRFQNISTCQQVLPNSLGSWQLWWQVFLLVEKAPSFIWVPVLLREWPNGHFSMRSDRTRHSRLLCTLLL